VVKGVSPLQSEGGEVSAVGNEAAAKNSEDPSAEAEENMERGEEEADENAERRDIVNMSDPREPSENERREHNEGSHLPFRSWRAHCIRGRGREADRRRYKEQSVGLHELHFDFMLMGKKMSQEEL